MALNANTRCNGFWYEEQVTEELLLRMVFKKVLFDSESEYQRVQIMESVPFGKTLVLDDHTQVSTIAAEAFVRFAAGPSRSLLTVAMCVCGQIFQIPELGAGRAHLPRDASASSDDGAWSSENSLHRGRRRGSDSKRSSAVEKRREGCHGRPGRGSV